MEPQGLYGKYKIFKADTGKEITGWAFVLKPEKDYAARVALAAYAEAVRPRDPELARDLRKLLQDLAMEDEVKEDYGLFVGCPVVAGDEIDPDRGVTYGHHGEVKSLKAGKVIVDWESVGEFEVDPESLKIENPNHDNFDYDEDYDDIIAYGPDPDDDDESPEGWNGDEL